MSSCLLMLLYYLHVWRAEAHQVFTLNTNQEELSLLLEALMDSFSSSVSHLEMSLFVSGVLRTRHTFPNNAFCALNLLLEFMGTIKHAFIFIKRMFSSVVLCENKQHWDFCESCFLPFWQKKRHTNLYWSQELIKALVISSTPPSKPWMLLPQQLVALQTPHPHWLWSDSQVSSRLGGVIQFQGRTGDSSSLKGRDILHCIFAKLNKTTFM